jgi:hypothetical protein
VVESPADAVRRDRLAEAEQDLTRRTTASPSRAVRREPADDVRLTDFWQRMDETLGPAYARSWAHDHVVTGLDSRTVDRPSPTASTPSSCVARRAPTRPAPARR